jgi:antibiotic biosynthesis monooxygenase (ABM) superfamily enzyme
MERRKNSPKWKKSLIVLTLTMLVPFANIYAIGYMLLWGSQPVFGKSEKLPTKIFMKTFLMLVYDQRHFCCCARRLMSPWQQRFIFLFLT